MHVQLAVNAFDVDAHGIDAHGEQIRDFLVGHALRQAIEHFLFTPGKFLDFVVIAAPLVEILDHLARDVAGHR